jgi:uncharacterized protein (DUF608 family)
MLQIIGATAATALSSRMPVMAGPFEDSDFEKLVPSDKKLSTEWVRSLFERGSPTTYRGDDLKFIGMPVGGFCAGQLYLGGDGRLWHWDIFNHLMRNSSDGPDYTHPLVPSSPLQQAFTVKIDGRSIPIDVSGFSDVSFRGQYPVGTVEYRDAAVPLAVTLEAFSPFIPLNTEDSSLPATVLRFTLRNTSNAPVQASLIGTLENAVALHTGLTHRGTRRNRIVAGKNLTFLSCSADKDAAPPSTRPDIAFEDWTRENYESWTVDGTAFGKGPIAKADIPAQFRNQVGGDTQRVVSSFFSAPKPQQDDALGKLTSRPFKIERDFITLWIGGGERPEECVNLLMDGEKVRTLTSAASAMHLTLQAMDVREFPGKQAVLEIVDSGKGGWGNVMVGKITFSDENRSGGEMTQWPDFGTMGLALIGAAPEMSTGEQSASFDKNLIGQIGRNLTLAPGASSTVTFLLTWHFPNLNFIPGVKPQGRHYANRFDSALAVATYISDNFDRLVSQTMLWRDTCYDSTLPWWFLERTFLNTSILATATCHRFTDGRFWGWEGINCCAGTCSHVWHYAQAVGRLFPEFERILRERVDFGLAQQPNGAIHFRAENNNGAAIDGQAGSILRALREHQMSPDNAFLKRIWPGVKKATQWLITQDGNNDGILVGSQHNTLDTNWYGAVAWLSGLYLAALSAAASMADDVNDAAFASTCRKILEKGRKNLVDRLFDRDYFINKVDPKHLNSVNSGTGCEIDQVLGQSWAFQVGLPRVLPEQQTRSALKSLWRYNFTPDVGPYRAVNKPGRWYAVAGEAGLLMCTFPRQDWDYVKARGGENAGAWAAMYFNECMNGFEHQVAGHMIWEGMVQEGLAVERAVHDRYHASKRNPWNEVECSSHYARSMASYGVFLAACGFEHHGPKGHLGFAPRLTPENFRAPFTTAEAWGAFSQKIENGVTTATIDLKYGKLRLNTLSVAAPASKANVTLAGRDIPATTNKQENTTLLAFATPLALSAGEKLEVRLS